jgi:hypothetical protein
VDDRQFGLEPLVREVRVERLQLGGGEHALVDDGPRGQRREIHAELVLGTLADPPGAGVQFVAVQFLAAGGCQERLGEVGHASAGHGTDEVGDDGHFTPAEDLQALVSCEALDACLGGVGFALFGGKERSTGHVLAGGGKFELRDGAEELVRDLHEEACAVTGAFVRTHGTAVLEVAEGREGGVHDVVAGFAAQGGDDRKTAGVLLLLGVVQPACLRQAREALERRHGSLRLIRFRPAGSVKSLGHGRRPSS